MTWRLMERMGIQLAVGYLALLPETPDLRVLGCCLGTLFKSYKIKIHRKYSGFKIMAT